MLTALATDLDDRSRMVREVEAERAKPRANMRTIVVVTLVLVVGMVLFARTFLSGYSTPLGQVACCWTSRCSGRRCGGCAGCRTRPGHRVCSLDPDLTAPVDR